MNGEIHRGVQCVLLEQFHFYSCTVHQILDDIHTVYPVRNRTLVIIPPFPAGLEPSDFQMYLSKSVHPRTACSRDREPVRLQVQGPALLEMSFASTGQGY
jgi:hypothetical protein